MELLPGDSHGRHVQCALCREKTAIYTCPRCQVRTCSLSCSKDHKAQSNCSGERDKVAYVPMNQYGWGTMADDYTFLEDVGRKVNQWGREIVRGGFMNRGSTRGARGMRGMRGMRGGMVRSKNPSGKTEYLSMQLSFRDIDMDCSPPGMEEHRLNRSYWDNKKRTAFLSIRFIFHEPAIPSNAKPQRVYKVLFHKNCIDRSLRDIVQSQVKDKGKAKRDENTRDWLFPLVGLTTDGDIEEGTPPPLCVLRRTRMQGAGQPITQLRSRPQKTYHRIQWDTPLLRALRHKSFVEFPTIELMDETDFDGILLGENNAIERNTLLEKERDEREMKRRKLNPEAKKKLITGLLGGYGSDEDGDGKTGTLDALGDYGGSDEDDKNLSANPSPAVTRASSVLTEEYDSGEDAEGEVVAEDMDENEWRNFQFADTEEAEGIDVPWAEGEAELDNGLLEDDAEDDEAQVSKYTEMTKERSAVAKTS